MLRLVVVHPDRRGAGIGSELFDAGEWWASDRGARRIELGGEHPFTLWPGAVPGGDLERVARQRGYTIGPDVRSLAVPTTFRAEVPDGVVVRRAVRDEDVHAVILAVSAAWSHRSDEVARALDHGTCHAAFVPSDDPESDDAVVGIGCHSVTRAGWVGPFIVEPGHRRRGIGNALLGQICRDLMIAELPVASVPAVANEVSETFLAGAGAGVAGTHRSLAKVLPA